MQNSTYNQLAAVTLSDKFYATEAPTQQLLHAAIGLQTEVGEMFAAVQKTKASIFLFDRVNFLEEIGDAAWYLSIPQRIFGFDVMEYETTLQSFDYPNESSLRNTLNVLNQETTEFLDILKKKVYYGREFDTEAVKVILGNIYSSLRILAKQVGGNWDTVLKNNIDKLAARYGDKFSEVLANNRDLATEYTILARK